jgi:gliding motility-associated-like protein
VKVNPLPIVVVGANRSFCSGLTLQLGAEPVAGFAYQWSPQSPSFSSSQVANPVYSNLNLSQNVVDSTYFLTVRNEVTGCENSDSIVISILPLPIADAGDNDTTCSGNTVVVGTASSPNRTYTWSSSTTNFTSNLSNPGFTFTANTTTTNTLTVLVTNTLTGCQSRDSVLVTHHPRPDRVSLIPFVPTVCPFSPGIRYSIANPPAGSTYQWSVFGGTLASGQGSNSVAVNWGGSNANARLRFVPINEFGCDGPADSVAIVINQILRPAKPVGDSVLCSAQAIQRVYTSLTTVNSTYTWRTINGNPPSFTTTGNSFTVDWIINNGLGRVWVEEVASTLDSSTVPPTPVQCFGQSDTLLVRINPTPLSNLSIGGEGSVCSITSDSVVYTLPGFANSSYTWTINPETGWVQRGANGSSAFSVGWVNVGTFTVSAFETSDQGCVGNVYTREVRVNPLPRPVITGNDLNICPQNLSGRSYTVSSSPGYPGTSTFNWTVTGGTFDGAATGSPIRVNWAEAGTRSLSVREISQFGCIKDTTLSLVSDNTSLVMNLVTTLPEDDKIVQINFAANNAETLAQTLTLERTELGQNDWRSIQTGIEKTVTVLTDNSINTSEKAYQYRVSTTNLCNVALTTLPHNTILLNGFGRENPTALGPENVKLTTLDWNSYQNWNPELAGFNLLRKVDNQSEFSVYESGINAANLRFDRDNGGDGFNQCYRIVALQQGTDRKAYSNIICVDFKNVLKFTNVITPNGDKLNDGWYIDNLKLYPENELLIFDRWGKKVYEAKNYSEDNLWDGGKNKPGTYFFTFKEYRNGQVYKGTITILD